MIGGHPKIADSKVAVPEVASEKSDIERKELKD